MLWRGSGNLARSGFTFCLDVEASRRSVYVVVSACFGTCFWTVFDVFSSSFRVVSAAARRALCFLSSDVLFPVVRRRFRRPTPFLSCPVVSDADRVVLLLWCRLLLLRRLVCRFYKVCVSVCFGINLGKISILTSSDKPEVKRGSLK